MEQNLYWLVCKVFRWLYVFSSLKYAIYRMGNSRNSQCPRCREADESHSHFVFHCKLSKTSMEGYIDEVINLNYTFKVTFKISFKIGLSPSKNSLYYLLYWNPFKIMKNAFYFTSKALFVLKIFKFLSWFFGHVAKRLD